MVSLRETTCAVCYKSKGDKLCGFVLVVTKWPILL